MSLLRTPWLILIELPVQANNKQRAQFPDQPDLTTLVDQEIKILGIEVFCNNVMEYAPSGNPVAPLSEYKKALLTLIDDDKKRVYQYPTLALNRVYSDPNDFIPHVYDLQLFDRLSKIAWTKSGVEFTEEPDNPPFSFMFGIHYDKLPGEATKTY